MSIFALSFAVYVLILVIIGLVNNRKLRHNEQNVFFADKSLGVTRMTLTVTAAWFGAATSLVTFENALKVGLPSLWTLGAPTLISLGIFLVLTPRLRKLGPISLSKFFHDHYGSSLSSLITLLVAVYMTLLAASQFVAWGRIASFFNLQPKPAIIIGALCVIIYSAIGGFRTVVNTDFLQFFLLSAAVILLFFGPFLTPTQGSISPQDLDFGARLPFHLSTTLTFTLAWTISPIIWQRIAAAKSEKCARWGLSLAMLLFGLLITMVALAAILWRPTVISSTSPFITIRQILPPWMGLLIELGLAAAIMSTADTALNTGALSLHPFLPGKFQRWSALNLRGGGVVILGVASLWIALQHQSIIVLLGLASEFMSCGLFIPGFYALITGKGPVLAGKLSVLFGGGFALLSFLIQTLHPSFIVGWPVWPYSSLLGIGLSALAFVWGKCLEKRRNQLLRRSI